MGKQAPAAPDFTGAAEKTAQSNRPDISTPFGQQRWAQGADGSWQMNQGFSGPMASVPGAVGQQASDALGNPLDLSSLGPMTDPTQARDQAIQAAYSQAESRLNPMWDQRETQLRSRLANQGLDPNSEAARNASQQFEQGRTDAYGSAMNNAIMQGTQAGQAVFSQGLQGRQQMLAEMLRQRGQPLAEMQALMGLLQMPNAAPGADYLGAAGMQSNADIQRWMAENQANADMMKGGMDLLSSGAGLAFMLSDERSKRDIHRESAEVLPGVPFASWEYRHIPGRRFRGVIAQDLERVAPSMVARGSDGFLRVNYAALKEAIHG